MNALKANKFRVGDKVQVIEDNKTPYQEEGYTENSLFEFVGDDGQFENGELIKLHYDDGDDCPDFKSLTRDRKRYCCLSEVEYVGEEESEDMLPNYEDVVVINNLMDMKELEEKVRALLIKKNLL